MQNRNLKYYFLIFFFFSFIIVFLWIFLPIYFYNFKIFIANKTNILIIRNQTKLPVIIDAGLGQASDATIAMELGCDGVLVNTAIAKAKKPFDMALAFKNAVIAGRQSYLSGRIDKTLMGSPSSPTKGII